MSYSENKWAKLGQDHTNKTKTSTTNGEIQSKAHKYTTSEQFVKAYSEAFLNYLDSRFSKTRAIHIADIAAQQAAFAEAFVQFVDLVEKLDNK
jgi:hypothetical protein